MHLLSKWLVKVALSNTTFHKVRKELWEQWTAMLKAEKKDGLGYMTIPLSTSNTIKQYLTSRSEKIADSDSMVLSFNKTIEGLTETLDELMMRDDKGLEPEELLPKESNLEYKEENDKGDKSGKAKSNLE